MKRLQQVRQDFGDHPFVLDLCTQDELMNGETRVLFDESGGYANWLSFLDAHASPRTIPCLLYVEDGNKENFQQQARQLHQTYGRVCLRMSATDELTTNLLIWLTEAVPERDIVVCGVLFHIEQRRLGFYQAVCSEFINNVIGNRRPGQIILPSSSFPRQVTDIPGAADDAGEIPAAELELYNWLKATFPNLPLARSDFASVHPIRYPATGGNWVPRIDVFNGHGFSYSRTRRTEGGYRDAAQSISAAQMAAVPACWGRDQIEHARAGRVTGGSPSFWISVRVNCWITAQAAAA